MVCHVKPLPDAENYDVDCWNTLGNLGERLAPEEGSAALCKEVAFESQ
jgi:hypothetical protein